MKIGWASDSDGPRIKALLAADGLNLEGGVWKGLSQTWLVARDGDGVPQACMAVHHGRPIARLDFLSIAEDVQGLSRVRAVKAILEAGMAVTQLRGASFVTGMVASTQPEFGQVLTTYGGQAVNDGFLYIAALREVLGNIKNGRTKVDHDHDSHADAGGKGIHPPAD